MSNPQTAPGGNDLLTIKQAGAWASEYLGRRVTASNIAYLAQYGKIERRGGLVSRAELAAYYDEFYKGREAAWKEKLGADVNWRLSFQELKEADTTKHVHRLHPYKGKFIPQLVEYFLDGHTDEFKREVFFRPGDIVLDPFSGSGTTVVQANESGLHGVGVDVSAFNALIGNTKVKKFDLSVAEEETARISQALRWFPSDSRLAEFDRRLAEKLSAFNAEHFPAPEFRRRLARKEINEKEYAAEKTPLFLPVYQGLTDEYKIQLRQEGGDGFLSKWYLQPIRAEIDFVFQLTQKIEDRDMRELAGVILSRAVRSCRATTHSDLATLKEPVTAPYYCVKHGKICKPLFSLQSRWETYRKDTFRRLAQFAELRTDTLQQVLAGDSRTIDIFAALEESRPALATLARQQKISGVFSSPPYVGVIDYHEQHAYAYDLFGFARRDADEIGPLFSGQGKAAQASYMEGIAAVLRNCRRFLIDDFNIFLVANDKYGLYPKIAEKANMAIINQYKRPVLNRTERDKAAYAEIIFHLKGK
jgi:hypothetical protein